MQQDKKKLIEALGDIWTIVYRTTQGSSLDQEKSERLQQALNTISNPNGFDSFFEGESLRLIECVRICGIFSIPPRRLHGTEEIISICERLQKHLER